MKDMKDKSANFSANQENCPVLDGFLKDNSSKMVFSGADPEAKERLAALLRVLLPGKSVTCKISQRADSRLINFNRRGGPEPDWYVHRDWNAELGHEVPRERTPEEEAEDEAEATAYEHHWNASITARCTLIIHALCDAVEVADMVGCMGSSFPDGCIRFTVPEDMAPKKPPVELAVYCVPNPCEPNRGDDTGSVRLIVFCLEEVIAKGECKT